MTALRVLVTGGSGKLGRRVVEALMADGHRVTSIDSVPWADAPCPTLRVEATSFGEMMSVFSGVDVRPSRFDALVHLAAIPAPGLRTDEATFSTNLLAHHAVVSSALRAGVRRIVWASSETVLGLPFTQHAPDRVPVDEAHGDRPNWSYALSKTLGEEMMRQFARWYPDAWLPGLRFSNVMEPAEYEGFAAFQDDLRTRAWNLWGYVDVRDAAGACVRALTADRRGARAYVIAAADTVMARPSAELMAEVFPDVPVTRPLVGRETLLSIDRARAELDYAPVHGWMTEA